MTPAEMELAKRLAAHPKWRWVAGMRALSEPPPQDEYPPHLRESVWDWRFIEGDEHIMRVDPDDGEREVNEACSKFVMDDRELWPDLADAATQGCLEARLYEAGEGIVAVLPDPVMIDKCAVYHAAFDAHGVGMWRSNETLDERSTKGEALGCALLAAWGDP